MCQIFDLDELTSGIVMPEVLSVRRENRNNVINEKGGLIGIRKFADIGMTFEDARSLYQSKQFEEAHELFLDCLARNPKDKTVQVYRDRCKLYMKMEADENMEGIARRITYERGL